MNNEASIILKVLDKASAPLRQIARSFQTMSKESRESLKQTASVAAGLGTALAGATLGAGAYAAKQTADMQSALGEVASLGFKDLEGLKTAALDFSNEWSGTAAPDFVRATYDIQSALSHMSTDAIIEYTRLAALTAKATRGSASEMTSLFGTVYGIYKKQFKELSDLEFGKVISAGLANTVMDFKTTGPKMQQAIEALGDSATLAGSAAAEQWSVLGKSMMTSQPSEAGTKFKAYFRDAAKAGGELGLPFLYANKQLKPLADVLDLLRKKYGETLNAISSDEIKKAFGSDEAFGFISKWWGQSEWLREDIKKRNAAMREGIALTEQMARSMNSGLGAEATKLGQRMNNLAEIVGETLTPVLLPLLRGLGENLVIMQAWVRENPNLVKGVMIAALAFGGLVAALGLAAAAMTVFNLAVWANPITWVVAGVVAALGLLVAAGTFVVTNWDKVKAWWSEFWDSGWADVVITTLGAVATAFMGPMGIIIALAAVLMRHWDEVGEFFRQLWDTVGNLTSEFVDTVMGTVKSMLDWLAEKISALTDWLPDWAKEKLGLKVAVSAQGVSAGAPSNLPATYREGGQAPASAAQAGGFSMITAQQALGQPQSSRFDGKMVVRFENAPRGTRIERMEQSGDSGLGLEAGLTLAPMF